MSRYQPLDIPPCQPKPCAQEAASSDRMPRNEADLDGILTELATVFDSGCKFHVKNQDEALPKFAEACYERDEDRVIRGLWATSVSSQITLPEEETAGSTPDTVDLTLEAAPQHEWIAFLISYFAHLGGLQAMAQVQI